MRNVFTIEYHRNKTGPSVDQQEKSWISYLDLDQVSAWEPCSGASACPFYCLNWHAIVGREEMIFPYATNLDDAIEAWKRGPTLDRDREAAILERILANLPEQLTSNDEDPTILLVTKSIVLLSGGIDSTTLLYHALSRGDEVNAISFFYGQRHAREIDYAHDIALQKQVKWDMIDISDIGGLLSGNVLTNDSIPVPEGHYEDPSMKATVVPNRNMMLLSIASSVALSRGFDRVLFAVHAGDHAIYPDCRLEFVSALNSALGLADWDSVFVEAPFLNMTKADIVTLGEIGNVPFEQTYSCYNGSRVHCGKCGTCVERKEAFEDAGVTDPTEYEDGK